MSNLSDDAAAPAPQAPYEPPSAGAVLRGAREGAGLSIDAVAQQLKLAPRQVQALEDDDFARLPGRTFVRGFVRNYARYVGLDPDDVVALLPGADVAPSLQRPTITPSSRPMGQMPSHAPAGRSWTRWAIPLALVAIVAAAGFYELRRPQGMGDARKPAAETPLRLPLPTAPPGSGGTTSAALPNPLTGGDGTASPAGTASGAPGGDGTSSASAPTAASSTALPAPTAGPSGTGVEAPAATAAAAPATASATPAEPLLVLTFKGQSWVQVKDRNGNVVFAETGQAGSTQAVRGAPPLDIVIGNAAQVAAAFRGQAIDLGPFSRGNVARLSIK